MKFIIAPDSFKGTMTALEICGLFGDRLRHHFPKSEVIEVPIADGGEGTIDCILRVKKGTRIQATVTSARHTKIDTHFAYVEDEGLVIVEMAKAAGLPIMDGRLTPMAATTYGVGELIAQALTLKPKKVLLALGGSATTDLGCGMAAALGAKFLDHKGRAYVPTGGSLELCQSIDLSGLNPAIKEVEFVTLCDVQNPVYGPSGAAHVFGPQKGANPNDVVSLDRNLKYMTDLLEQKTGLSLAELVGGGAAGGLGAGSVAFLGASLKPGIDTLLDFLNFDEILKGADIVFTGEGRLDAQSMNGKAIAGVTKRAAEAHVPVVILGGDIHPPGHIYETGVCAVFSTNRLAIPFESAKTNCRADFAFAADNICRLIKLSAKLSL